MGKNIVYSMRMSKKVREALEMVAKRERRTIASLLDKVVADFLEHQGYPVYESSMVERRGSQRSKTALPSITYLTKDGITVKFPCVVLDLSLGGALISYPRGSKIKATSLGELPNFDLCFELPRTGEEVCFRCATRRVFNMNTDLKVGAAFIDPIEDHMERLASYLM